MNLPIVYSYPCQWEMIPGRHRYLMEAMSAHAPIFFLNCPEFTGSYREVLRSRAERVSDRVTVIHNAFGLRFARGGKRLGRAGAMIDGQWLNRLLRAHGVEEYVYWLAAVSPRMLWGMRVDRLVYDCIDPCFDRRYQAKFDRDEAVIAGRAKVVFATADSLLQRMRRFNAESHLLMNACAAQDYEPGALSLLPRPQSLENRPGPVIGYMGTFDSRVDVEVLAAAAQRLPQFTFALVGRINGEQEARVAALRSLPNVLLPGAVSVEEGRRYTAAFDVGLIPFLPGEIGDAINPVKMWMYLMAGKPVVTTWLRECQRQAPYVTAVGGTEAFVAAIHDAAVGPERISAAERTAFAMRNRWQDRAAMAVEVLRTAGLLERVAPRAPDLIGRRRHAANELTAAKGAAPIRR